MNIGQIIADLRTRKNMSQADLAKALHVSPSTIGMWETNQRAIKDTQLKSIATFFNVSSDYLLGVNVAVKTVPIPDLNTKVSVYGSIRAGSPTFAQQEIIGEVIVSDKIQQKYGKKNLFALMVKGNSMNRKVPEGTVAIFAKEAAIENGDIVAVLIDGQDATIKQYRETTMAVIFQPMSYDEKFSPIIVPKRGEQDFKILGKMVYFVSGDYI